MNKQKLYTNSEIENEARKYNTISDFQKYSPNYYVLARARKLMPKFREFLQTKLTTWTDEMLKEEALKYRTKNEFAKNSSSAYTTARKRKILDEITTHMPQVKIWTKEEAKNESLKYNSKIEFKKSPAHHQSVKNGWLDEFFDNVYVYWDKDKAHKEALKYNTKTEFQYGSFGAYLASYRHGWINDITSHMIPVGNLYKRMVYVYEFPNNHVYIGLTSDKKRRHKEHTNVDTISSPVVKHIIETGLDPTYKEESAYIDAQDAQNLEQCTIDRYRNDGWIILNTAKAGSLGGGKKTKLTIEIIRDIASQYPTRVAFKKAHINKYAIAQKYGWLEDVFANIPKQYRTKWNYNMTKKESLKYNTRTEFNNGNQSAYRSAVKNKWIDEFFPK